MTSGGQGLHASGAADTDIDTKYARDKAAGVLWARVPRAATATELTRHPHTATVTSTLAAAPA